MQLKLKVDKTRLSVMYRWLVVADWAASNIAV